ncbi:hypothetical protein PF002_g20069 [Phytophthora fragariae]|uniref:Uncharacterized protein n=2 Tax=Phytophthora fragariae TaxID=53985 RepID=A0A6A3XPN8_9STRA|nr:hypothetical protein PF002_g20069 [Phytophthora fragariae]
MAQQQPQQRDRRRVRPAEAHAHNRPESALSKLSAKIDGAEDWKTAEGCLPNLLYEKLQPYTQTRGQARRRPPAPNADTQGGGTQAEDRDRAAAGGEAQHRPGDDDGRPPVEDARRQQQPARDCSRRRAQRNGRRQRRHPRLPGPRQGDQQQRRPSPAIAKARRRVGRIRSVIDPRHRFDSAEKECVEAILEKSRAEREARTGARTTTIEAAPPGATPTPPLDDGMCPISSDRLWQHFEVVNTPPVELIPRHTRVKPSAPRWRDYPPPAARFAELLTEAPTADHIETQLQHARGASSSGRPRRCQQRRGRGGRPRPHPADTPILTMTHHQSYAYLGIGDGFDHVRRRIELAPKLEMLKQDATALIESGLAPWQVVKTVEVYLYPRVEYALRHLHPEDQQLKGFDDHLRRNPSPPATRAPVDGQ